MSMKPETAQLIYESWIAKIKGRLPTSGEQELIEHYKRLAQPALFEYVPSNDGDKPGDW